MGATCSNLNEYQNACQAYECVENLIGLKSNSASPTGTWIITFYKNVNYNEVPIKDAFIKWFINPDSIPEGIFPDEFFSDKYINTLRGLQYEIDVYRYIIRPLIEFGICPNFVRYLGSSSTCSSQDMIKFLVNKANLLAPPPRNVKMKQKEATQLFERQIIYIANQERKRPSINNPDPATFIRSKIPEQALANINFELLINETVKALDFQKWFIDSIFETDQQNISLEVWRVIFQVLAACYAMSSSHMTHNDLHTGNVWVEERESVDVSYYLNKQFYRFNTRHKALVYDFDRAYVEQFGNNPLIEAGSRTCERGNQCNEFIPNKDAVKFLGYIYSMAMRPEDKKKVLEILSNSLPVQESLAKVYNTSMFLIKPDGMRMTSHDFGLLNTMEQILINASRLIEPVMDINAAPLDPNYLYVCNPDMFSPTGRILIDKKASSLVDAFDKFLVEQELSKCLEETQKHADQTIVQQIQELLEQFKENYQVIPREKVMMELE